MRSLLIVLGLSLATAAQAQRYPSPTDWRNENIYQILTDRFYNGNPSNDSVEASRGSPYDPTYNAGIHGGDFQGIQNKLDYIKALGATAIWISPIPLNIGDGSSAYHGYAAQDFYTLAPHWGTMTDLSNMVQAAHARGIKVILDIVCNHMGNLLTSNDPNWPNWEAPPAGYVLQYINITNQHAFPFNPTNVSPTADLSTIFHTNGDIQSYDTTQEVVLGQLDGLNDLATETTYVRTNLMNIYTNWVGLADFDAFRIDTVKHVDYGFWQYWCPQLHQFAASIGKSNFFMFGEIFNESLSDDPFIGSYTGTMAGGPYMLDSTLDYVLYGQINSVFATASGPTQPIETHYDQIAADYDTNAWYRLVTFLDNHDNPRFLSNVGATTNRLAVALEFLYTSRGIPSLYYGTEQAFSGDGNNNDNREDMFAGQFEPDPSSVGDNFNETHPLFQLVAKLNNFRRLYPALCTGVHNNLYSDPNEPGLFAYSRVLSNEEVFVCFNTATSDGNLTNCPTTYAPGTVLVNLLNTNDTIIVTSSGGTNVTPFIDVPSTTAKIYIAQSLVLPLNPVVVSQSPSHAATCVSGSAPIVLLFSKPMNTNSVQAAFSVTPATTGTFTWNAVHDTMTFMPSTVWPILSTNLVHLTTNAMDSVNGMAFYAPFDTFFVAFTTNTITVSSSPPGGGATSGSGLVNCGSNVTVCATPNACYNFLYWTQNGSIASTSPCYSFPVAGNENLVANFVNAQVALAIDNAADPAYTGGWTNGTSGGSGFDPWILLETVGDSTCNGFFDSSSTKSSPHAAPGIDVNGDSWGMYANSESCGEATIAAAFRAFGVGSMQLGGQILLDMDNGYNDTEGGAVGFALRNGNAATTPADYATGARLQFYLAGYNDDYAVVDAAGVRDTGVPLTYSGLHLIFTLGTNDSYTLSIVSYGSGTTNIISGTLAGTTGSTLDSIALFNNDNGADSEHDVFFNSLTVINLTPLAYDVNTSSSPVIGGTTSGGGIVACGSNVTVCASANASCYRFANWTLNSNVVSTSACYSFSPTGSCNLVANFTPLAYYTISTSNSPAGEGSTSGGATVPCGSNVTVCANALPCYIFATWTVNGNVVSTSSCYTFAATSNETLVANFVPAASYTITTSSSPSAGGSTSGGGTVGCHSNTMVCATTNPCYRFTYWTDPYSNVVSALACYTFTPNGNINLTANFVPLNDVITTSSSPAAGGSTSGGGSVICGSNVTVCATPNSCFRFVNWTVNSSVVGTAQCYSFAAVTNETVVANFATISYGGTGGSGLTTLHSFDNNDGAYPIAGLVLGNDSNFYGTTYYGGAFGSGAVFRVSSSGSFTALYSFSGPDGAFPYAGLVQGSDGNFYGMTYQGGASDEGTVFRITPSGSLTNLHSFSGPDGAYPLFGGLVLGSDSNLYGTTEAGGANGAGTVFRITPGGSLTTLHSFSYYSDGGFPFGGLVLGSDTNFYGTTYEGGSGGSGTVFRISSGGSFTNLHFFSGHDGAFPFANLIQASDGNFYGMTYQGGTSGDGTVFRISAGGNLTNLWSFSGCSDGGNPQGALLQANDGNLYGTTSGTGSGASSLGNVFRLSLSGNFTNIWVFTGGVNGEVPFSTLVQGNDYALYGTALYGGQYGDGTVFRLNVGLCGIVLAPGGVDFSSAGGTGSVTVTTSTTNCVWTATSNSGFITITSGNNGTGSGTVRYTVAADTDSNSFGRAGTMSIAGQTFTVTQASLGCGFTLGATNASFDAAGGSGSVTVSVSGSNCAWTAISNSGFITINSGSGGGGNGTVTYAVSANTSSSSLTGTMTIAGQIFTVTQGGFACSAVLAVSSSPAGGGTTSGGSTVGCGSNVTVCATPNACYSFVNWTVNGNAVSAPACSTFAVTSNETLVANFAPIFSFTINTSSSPPAGGSTSGGGAVACGSNVTVRATPNACYSFVNWTDQNSNVVSTLACYTFTPDANFNFTANFAKISSYTISITGSPPAGGSTSGGGAVACGSNVTVCATPNACYNFVNWTDQNSNVVSASACYSFAAAGNETLAANFAVNDSATGGSLTNLWSFTGASDGAAPVATLVQGNDGNFYGTTIGSGSGPSSYGTVFRIGTNGALTTLWSFTNGKDGANPEAGLAQGSDGNFYGTTFGSGSGPSSYGTVFRISSSGNLTSLWSFTNGSDGANPYATLVQGSDGNFYGTTSGSGSGPNGYGTVFRITPSGSLSNLHSFVGADGANPSAGLVQGSDGNFYGTTYAGANNYGTVFRISSSGSLTTLWSFTNGLDGANSFATLVLGSDGKFYGTTYQGGASGNGTVFRISSTGNLTNLWEFTGCGDGGLALAGLVQGSDGNFYGTTAGPGSGPSGYGTVFRISPNGGLATLHSFGTIDGANPNAALVQGSDGKFYGTTSQGGASGNGTVFQLTIPLHPPANQISAIRLAGGNVIVIIPSVAGETYQLQYSDSLTLSNWSNVGGVSVTNSIGGLLSLTNFGGALQPQGFYRFAITP